MRRRQTAWANIAMISALAITILVSHSFARAETPAEDAPLTRALGFLSTQVPKWRRENACYSCHHNGDAARALMQASSLGVAVNRDALRDTLEFLRQPQQWDGNGPEGPFKDRKLARLQFAAALVEASKSGMLADQTAVHQAARLVAELQETDGSWGTDASGTIGSPVTYGRPLATCIALSLLPARAFETHRARALAWFEKREPKNILDASASLLALQHQSSETAAERRRQSLALIRAGQSEDGGWGPFTSAPPEVFDTSLVVLALAAQPNRAPYQNELTRGRQFLLNRQLLDGSWPATTRPTGINSYAQQLSTTAWATQALLVTTAKRDSDTHRMR